MSSNKLIKLVPKEGKEFIRFVDKEVAKKCLTLGDMLEICADTEERVHLPTISAKVLDKIIEWIEYHNNGCDSDYEEYNKKETQREDIDNWDKNFFAIETESFFDLLVAANYLACESLLSVGSKFLSKQLKEKTAEEVRNSWRITCDLDPEVEQKIRQENKWAQRNADYIKQQFERP